jgi:hypothetical protein
VPRCEVQAIACPQNRRLENFHLKEGWGRESSMKEGSRNFYEWLNDNSMIEIHPVGYTTIEIYKLKI